MYRGSAQNIKDFRSAVALRFKLRAIDVVNWDGTERNMDSIVWAVCHYPRDSGEMMPIIAGAVGVLSMLLLKRLTGDGSTALDAQAARVQKITRLRRKCLRVTRNSRTMSFTASPRGVSPPFHKQHHGSTQ